MTESRVTVHVINEGGVPIFIGRPSNDDEYVRIIRETGRPARLEASISDMSASWQVRHADDE